MPSRSRPRALIVRLRHPNAQRPRAVSVNGQDWSDVDPAKEQVRIASPASGRYVIRAKY